MMQFPPLKTSTARPAFTSINVTGNNKSQINVTTCENNIMQMSDSFKQDNQSSRSSSQDDGTPSAPQDKKNDHQKQPSSAVMHMQNAIQIPDINSDLSLNNIVAPQDDLGVLDTSNFRTIKIDYLPRHKINQKHVLANLGSRFGPEDPMYETFLHKIL